MAQQHYLKHTTLRTIKSPTMSKETAIMAVVEEVDTDVAVAEVSLAADEVIRMDEIMDEIMDMIVAHLDEVMVVDVDFRLSINTRPNQVNQCAIDVEWTIIRLRPVELQSILLSFIKRV